MGNKNSTHFYHDEIYLDPHTHRPEKLVQHKYEACLYESKKEEKDYKNEYLIESNKSGMKPDEWQDELNNVGKSDRIQLCKDMKKDKLRQITSMNEKILEDNLVFNCIDNKVQDEVERELQKITNIKNTENIIDYNDCNKDTNLPELISNYNNDIIKKYRMNTNYSKYTKSLENLTNKIKNIEKSAKSNNKNIKDYVENNKEPSNDNSINIGDTTLENNDLIILENICKININDKRLVELRKCNNSKRESNCINNFNYYKEYEEKCRKKCKDGDRTGDCKDERDNKQGGNLTRIFKNAFGKGFFPLLYWLFVVFTILLFGLIFSYIFYFLKLIFVHLIYDPLTNIMIGVTPPDNNKDSYDKTDGREFKSYLDNAPSAIIKNICKLFAIMIRNSYWWIIPIWLVLFVTVLVFWYLKKTFGWWPASMVWDSIGIFSGSKTAFRWLDAVEGCNKKSNRPIICNGQAVWNLLEDWNYENTKLIVPNLDEDEFRQSYNFYKTFNPEYNWSGTTDKKFEESIAEKYEEEIQNKYENFTDYNKYKNNNNLIENFFIMDKLIPAKQKLNDIIKKNKDELRQNNENNKNKGEKNKKDFEDYLDSQDNSE